MTEIMGRQYTLIIDKSGSMESPGDLPGKTRWETMQENTLALARKCDQLDPDGINVYLFSGRHKFYSGVTASKVQQIFQENHPAGSTNLAGVLKAAFDDFFKRREQGLTPNGETIIVVTDGEPDDRKPVYEQIILASRKIDSDEELAVLFFQIGDDPGATKFLRTIDDELTNAGANFDIADVTTADEIEDIGFAAALDKAIVD
ncbi:VWA domain-containing protein [Nodularia spumigena CS-591/12]|uniref:VWA domain-containing protein n=1 Tax=Nodularia spumigena TaxID=70799 RepID=UPI00232EF222|nr:VWA domain-containing protein [Nodularia spumigena]MDB9305079.1 VWA domain-containing protein [Nodularia spumigena CS-591/12]